MIGDSHPQFTIHALGASPRSAGKLYPEAVNWKLAEEIPSSVSKIEVRTCEPTGPFTECDVVFSGLDADVAGDIGFPPFVMAKVLIDRNGISKSEYTYLFECKELSKSETHPACCPSRKYRAYFSAIAIAEGIIRVKQQGIHGYQCEL